MCSSDLTGEHTFAELVAEQTPGGLNEQAGARSTDFGPRRGPSPRDPPPAQPRAQVVRELTEAGAFSALTDGERYGWPFVWTSNLSAPTEALLAAGGFDEGRFDGTVCDGLDLGLRLEEQGVGVLHRADCVAHHDHVITPEGFFERAFQLGRYQYRLGEKAGAPDVFFEAGTVTGAPLAVSKLKLRSTDVSELTWIWL